MSVKYFDKSKNKWVIFPGTVGAPGKNGKDAYDIAVEHGYEGSEEEYNNTLLQIPEVVNKLETIDNTPTKGSNNLVTSGGVKDAIDSLDASLSGSIENIIDVEISNQIKSSIVDNLLSDDVNKSLSAKQGKILKGIIDNLANIQFLVVDVLPSSDIKSNIIYLVKKKGSGTDVHDEYIYIENNWEKIGDTSIDLTNYYTKDQVDSQIQNVREDIPSIPDVDIVLSGRGNVITELAVDSINKHKLVASKSISVYTKEEVEEKLSESGYGDVTAATEFSTADRVITSNGEGKVIKDSGVLIGNLAKLSDVPKTLTDLNVTSTDITDILGYIPADSAQAGMGDVTGPTSATNNNFASFNNNSGKIIKDSGYNPDSFARLNHTHTVSQITDMPTPITVDSELNSTSENPVQNKVINNALSSKVDTSTLNNYVTKDEIAELGGGDVVAVGDLANNMLVIGKGTKSVSASNIPISDISTLKTNVSQLSNSVDELTQQILEFDYINSIDINGDSGDSISINSQNHTISIGSADSYLATTVENDSGDLKLLIGHKSGYDHVPTINQADSDDRIAFVPSGMTSYRLGVIGRDIRIPAAGIDGLADVAKSGSYNDLTETPEFKSLHIQAGELSENYNPTIGEVNLDLNTPLDNRYEKLLGISSSAGDPGTWIEVTETAHTINVSNLTASRSEAIVVVRGDCTVSFSGSNIYIINNASDLAGTSTQRKVYTVKRIEDDSNNPMVLITCALYNPNN